MSRTHILQFVPSLRRNGVGAVIMNLSKYLDSSRYRVSIACAYTPDQTLSAELSDYGIAVYDLGCRSFADVTIVMKVRRLVRELGVDIIHSHSIRCNLYTRLARSILGARSTVSTLHDSPSSYVVDFGHWVGNLLLYAQGSTFSCDGAVAAVAHSVAEAYSQSLWRRPRNLVVIHNGSDAPLGDDDSPQSTGIVELDDRAYSCTFGTFARLVPRKGLWHLLEAAAIILRVHRDVGFYLVGSGPLDYELRKRVSELGISENFHFLGHRSDISALLSSIDCVILPSLEECLPMTLIEAMRHGRAIVATAVGGVPELIRDRVDGILVPSRDERALAEAIEALAVDPDRRMQYGACAQRSYEQRFTGRKMAIAYERLYEQCL